jgi:para-aminobenzoate synthetase component 1
MSVEIRADDLPDLHRPLPAQVPLVEEITPAPDAWETCQRLAHLPGLLFLDSASRLPELGRYSYVTANPFAVLTARGNRVGLNGRLLLDTNPFRVLQEQLGRWRLDTLPDLPPFQGGAAGLLGYDLCHHIERLPRPRFDEFQFPDLALGFYDWVVAFDHALDRCWVVSTGWPETHPQRCGQRAAQRLLMVKDALRRTGRTVFQTVRDGLEIRPTARGPLAPLGQVALKIAHPVGRMPEMLSSFDRESYLATIRRAIEYVHAGDCFQVNIAQRLLYPARLAPLELYHRLRQRNPAPFGAYFDFGDLVIASASPERFLRIDRGEVETRPIKGTRPRGLTPEEDQAQVAELRHSAKDRAENVMIVDLLRNDLGRVCQYGSVKVEAVCRVETYQYVHHLVSVVRGRLRDGLGPVDLLRAAFPGGSVTGAPKVRAMEIIAELEPVARGPYTGSLGWIGFDGNMDTNLLIRTFTMGRGWVQFPVGGGIVADSVPEQEYEETWHKAEGLLRALR